jgi:hypothetical protein
MWLIALETARVRCPKPTASSCRYSRLRPQRSRTPRRHRVRLGYKSFDEFVKGWTWTFKPKNKAADEVKFNAVRHEYTVILPVTEIKSGDLILNFYPPSPRDKVIELLLTDNTKLFETV